MPVFQKTPISGNQTASIVADSDFEVLSRNQMTLFFSGVIYGKENRNSAKCTTEWLAGRFLAEGVRSLTGINGKFLLIIESADKIYIIRDINGTGSQVYYSESFFTNSFKLFTEFKSGDLKAEMESVRKFLKDGFIPAPYTSLEGVFKLGPEEFIEFNKVSKKYILHSIDTYESFLKNAGSLKLNVEEAVEIYSELHKNSILRRIEGEGSAGILLSGGYDSGGNLAALRQVFDGKITAFSAGFANNPWSELPYAAMMAKQFGADHEVFYLEPDDIEALPQLVSHFGDPFFESGMMLNYKVSKETGRIFKGVVLGGDGNDQLFGTTGREMAMMIRAKSFGLSGVQMLLERISGENDRLFRMSFYNRNIIDSPFVRQLGLTEKNIAGIVQSVGNKGISSAGTINSTPPVNDFNSLYYWRNYNSDINQSAQQIILYKAASMSALHKVNLTFPYFDKEIKDFVNALPREMKLKGTFSEIIAGKGVSKYLFKQYLRHTLPSEITGRKKQGGFAPLSIFLTDITRREAIYGIIRSTLRETGLFSYERLNEMLLSVETAVRSENSWFWYRQTKFNQLFILLVLAIWWRVNIMSDYRNKLSEYNEKA